MREVLKKNYEDIREELLFTKNEYVDIEHAFIQNGMLTIQGYVLASKNGNPSFDLMPVKYAPKPYALGYVTYYANSDDNGKVQSIVLNDKGTLSLWVPYALSSKERFTFMYSL